MVGSLFAGTDESPGETILYQNRTYKVYRGMGSLEAMKAGSRDRYAQEGTLFEGKLVPEGIEGMVPYKGSIEVMIPQLVGGLRAGMGYCGRHNIAALQTPTRFIRITSFGLKESHVHDVLVTRKLRITVVPISNEIRGQEGTVAFTATREASRAGSGEGNRLLLPRLSVLPLHL